VERERKQLHLQVFGSGELLAMHGATQPQLQVPPKPRWPRWRKP